MGFDTGKTISYWLNSAEYDLGVAESLLESGKYPYALFLGHLALEKILKALVVKEKNDHAPYTHSLSTLAKLLPFEIDEALQIKFSEFMDFHFEARYPEEKNKFYDKCTKSFTEDNLKEITRIFNWLKTKL